MLEDRSVVTAFVFLMICALVTIQPAADPDLFARVAVGRLIELTGRVVDQDPFAFSPLLPRWIDHEWLSGVVFYRVAQVGGDGALLLFSLLTMGTTVALVIKAQDERSRASLEWSAIALLHLFGAWISIVRSHVFTFVFAALVLLVLVRWRNNRVAWLWLLPPCFLLWANFHGGFVVGLGWLGSAATAVTLFEGIRKSIPLWICLAGCIAATLLNPYGLEYWTYILSATSMERELILEWQTMRPWQIGLMTILLAIFFAGAHIRKGIRAIPPEVAALILVSIWAAADSQRLLNYLLLVLAVYGAAEYRAVRQAVGSRFTPLYRRAVRNVAAAGVLLLGMFFGVGVGKNLYEFSTTGLDFSRYPVGAVEWLERSGAGGRVLTHFNHGSYALWRLYPEYQVAVDGRYEETYPEETVALAWKAIDPYLPGHEEALSILAPDYIVVPSQEWAEGFGTEWQRVYTDETGVVLARPGLTTERSRPARSMWVPGF